MNALITGFPRLLARGLAQRILGEGKSGRVSLLVSTDDAEATLRFLESLPVAQRPRVTCHVGRALDLDLGLSGADITQILGETTHIFHTASALAGPRAMLRRQNVWTLARLLLLAREMPRLARFCLFSTAFVSGSRSGIIFEEDLDHGQRFRTTYERTLFEAERIARDFMPRVPITVLRPASMLGHSQTGETDQQSEGPNYLVRLLVKLPAEVPLPLPGTGVVPLNIVPVDYVVRAALVLAMRPEAVSRTFHLTDPHPLSARQAFEILSDLANRPATFTGTLPMRLIRQVLRLPGMAQLAPNQLALFENLNTHVEYDCSGTLELLSASDVICPPFEAYADQLVAWVAQFERTHRARQGAAEPGGEAGDE